MRQPGDSCRQSGQYNTILSGFVRLRRIWCGCRQNGLRSVRLSQERKSEETEAAAAIPSISDNHLIRGVGDGPLEGADESGDVMAGLIVAFPIRIRKGM